MKLVLGSNLYDELPQDLLVNTKNLEEFQMLSNNGTLVNLPRGLFKNLTRLQSVHIGSTQLETLPADLFAGCSTLDSVTLYYNRLESLLSGLFGDTKNLRLLNVDYNRLQLLPAGIFKGLNNLEKVSIDNNQLTMLPSEVLEGLQSVQDFSVTGNNLTWIGDQFMTYLKSAESIDLSFNQITFDSRSRIKLLGHQNKSASNSLNEISSNTSESKTTPTLLAIRNDTGSQYVSVFMGHSLLRCDCNIFDFVHYLNGENENSMYKILNYEWGQFKCASPAKFKNQDIREISLKELSCLWKSNVTDDACNETCDCLKYPEKGVLSVDCSHRNLTRIPALNGNTQNLSIELNMTGNMLQHSPSLKDSYLVNVTSLDLSYNHITEITTDLFSPKLQYLRLHGNSLSRLDSDVINHLSGRNNTLRNITLHDNKWFCDCAARELVTFIQLKLTTYVLHEMRCYESHQKLSEMTPIQLCKNFIIIIVTSCLSITFLCMIVASLIALYHKYEREIKIWLYSKQLCLWLVTEVELDQDKEYDAFISFSQKDEHFVEKEIVAKLEKGPRPHKLCLHYRDWLAGEWIPVQISRSVEASRRTIVVLTPNFLESVWGLLEFRTAHTQALKDGRARLIVIIYGDIGNIDDLDQEMKDYLRLNTYIKWGDPWFWDKLRYALPHSKEFLKRNTGKAVIAENHFVECSLANNSGANSSNLIDDSTENKNFMSSC